MVTTAQPKMHIDNDRVLVAEWDLAPGESTGSHRHECDYVVVPLTDGTLDLVASDGTSVTGELTAGIPYFRTAGVEHEVINAGATRVVFIETELK